MHLDWTQLRWIHRQAVVVESVVLAFLFDPPQPAKDSTMAVDRAIDNIFFILTLLKVVNCMIV